MSVDSVNQPAVTRRLTLPVPAGFSFERTVASHGWFDLPPFQWDPDTKILTRTLRLEDAGPVVARIRQNGPLKITLTSFAKLSRAGTSQALAQIAHILRLDEDLEGFYRMAREVEAPDLRWTAASKAGRLMRSPEVFEDLVKMICTTNCTWALTKVMVTALVARLGEAAPGGLRTFPTPAAMARRPAAFYRDVLRRGDLAAYEVHERFYEIGTLSGIEDTGRFLTERGL